MNHQNFTKKKENVSRKEAYSLRIIRDVFLEMLGKQPIQKISVIELCRRADINRSTFYRYYADIYDLLDSIVEDCCRELFDNLVADTDFSGSFEENGYAIILRACEITEEHQELYRLLLFGPSPTPLLQKLSNSIKDVYLSHHQASSYRSLPEMDLYYHYLTYGIIGVWSEWVRGGCEIPKEKTADSVRHMISGFFQTMNEQFRPSEKGSTLVEKNCVSQADTHAIQ